jgi:hypothetical protein
MRARAGFLGGILVLLVGAGVAWLAYQAGLSQAATTAAGTASVVVYGGAGFGFFHIVGIIFGLFLLFGLARLLFGLLFWRGPRHWSRMGMGPGAAGPGGFGHGGFGPGHMGRWADREAFVAEMHRRLHEADAAAGTGATGAPGITGDPGQPKS